MHTIRVRTSDVILVAAIATLTSACTDPSSKDGEAESAAASSGSEGEESSGSTGVDVDELASCPEDDFAPLPFAGPAFDAEGTLVEPLPLPHIVATTVGWPRPEPEHANAVAQASGQVAMSQLFTQDGLLGASFGLSPECGSARTLTIWRDEAALMDFVFSGVHFEAVQTKLVHTLAWETTRWTETSSAEPPSWDEARQQLTAARR